MLHKQCIWHNSQQGQNSEIKSDTDSYEIHNKIKLKCELVIPPVNLPAYLSYLFNEWKNEMK